MTNGRLLLVEDDALFRDTLRLEFTERDYEVLVVDRACTQMFVFSPDWAIVDLRLDHDHGLEIVAALRAKVPACRVLVLTGYGSIASAVDAMKLGCIDYLSKPVDIDILEMKLTGSKLPLEDEASPSRPSLARHEREYIERVVRECGGNISRAARELGIHRQSLQRKLRKYPPKI